ncbi:hypothetical protein WISP_35281 [Willisornis vidua]|uniref:Uncharacterized protein n=1 Tax=Willisornis vidua TaxID=1566151 RepID=A0ABQ9DIV7_9PASS|nr:hypothetical protein WISP_35281 [Willisornis vidua]
MLKATEQVKASKAAGVDGIPHEIWEHGGQALHVKFHELIVCSWEQGELPPDLRDAVIITLYKKKGENQTPQITEAGVISIEAMLLRTQLFWAGHVSRMEDHHLPKIVLYGELDTGCRKKGALMRQYKNSLKQHLSLGHIDCHQWSTLTSSRDS